MKRRKTVFSAACDTSIYAVAVAGLLVVAPPAPAATNVLTDQAIVDAVEDEFDYDPAIWSEKIDIVGNRGIIALNGVTDNLLEKERAAKVARTVKGVRSVVNNIKVRPVILKTGEELANDVVASLANDPATDAYEISVVAKNDGSVTLTGTVDSWQEKHLAEIVAKGTVGVTDVDNRVEVNFANAPNRPADEIRAEVEQRLFWDVLVDDALIDVSVSDRAVTLTGAVGSASERYRAKYLSRVVGVSKVDASGLKIQDWAKDPNRRNPDYANKSDEEIETALKDALRYDPRVSDFTIDVDLTGGEATLRGQVDNLAAKRAAEQDARNTVGVDRVTNRIKVRAVAELSDEDLAERVRSAFLRDPYVDNYQISVVVEDQVAKLYGSVDSYFEKTQADIVAERVKGVTSVVNNLVVRQDNRPLAYDPYVDAYPPYLYGWYNYRPVPTYRSDAAIRNDIKDELWWSPFVDSDDVTVTVSGGRATLTGTVDSWSEWHAASENAWEGGAIWVVNNLDVASTGQG